MKNEQKPANPGVLVIFGVVGDLNKRLLLPAICNLGSVGLLDNDFSIVGVARTPHGFDTFHEELKKSINEFVKDPAAKKFGDELLERMNYVQGEFTDASVYTDLKNKLAEMNASKNYLFYLAVPPEVVQVIVTDLGKVGLLSEQDRAFRRIIVEKPFGTDLDSAEKLNTFLLSLVSENQIFRVDHFLGKETVQNILAFRFANSIFEPLWNANYIDHVQITVAETLGVESRGSYYEQTGALRDMVPNHLFQLLSLIAMEAPASYCAADVSAEKQNVFRAIEPMTPEKVPSQAVRGQYGPGKTDDKAVVGYRSEPDVSPTSNIETYAALKLFINNSRWKNVPFYLRTGKRMAMHKSEIIVQFKNTAKATAEPNIIQILIQPEEGIALRFNAKVPGPGIELRPFDMNFNYLDHYNMKSLTGYEPILYDCMNGDQMLFKQADMIETGWALVQPILDVWKETAADFPNYAAGSYGPKAADELLEKDGRKWFQS